VMAMTRKYLKEIIENVASDKKTRVIHALDIIPKDDESKDDFTTRVFSLVDSIKPYIAALKIGYPFVLASGLETISRIKKHVEVPLIADFKVADIKNTNKLISKMAFKAGFDAIIAHAFVGTDALEGITEEIALHKNKGLFIVINMSHPGSMQFITPVWRDLVKVAIECNATGVIAPGTRPTEVKQIRETIGDELLILSPGIGAQGGGPGQAILNGADFEIIGRAIYNAKDPKESAKELAKKTWESYVRRKSI